MLIWGVPWGITASNKWSCPETQNNSIDTAALVGNVLSFQASWKSRRIPTLTLKKLWWYQPQNWHIWSLVRLVSLKKTIERLWSKARAKAMMDAAAVWGLACSLLQRLPAFCFISDVLTIFHSLVDISFEKRASLWSWPGANTEAAFVDIAHYLYYQIYSNSKNPEIFILFWENGKDWLLEKIFI